MAEHSRPTDLNSYGTDCCIVISAVLGPAAVAVAVPAGAAGCVCVGGGGGGNTRLISRRIVGVTEGGGNSVENWFNHSINWVNLSSQLREWAEDTIENELQTSYK